MLRVLKCSGVACLSLLLTTWLWSIPLYMWVLPKPYFGLQMLAIGMASFYSARFVLVYASSVLEAAQGKGRARAPSWRTSRRCGETLWHAVTRATALSMACSVGA